MNNFEKSFQPNHDDREVMIKMKALRDADASLSGNPQQNYKSGSLRDTDVGYIAQVETLAEKNLARPDYLKKVTDEVLKEQNPPTPTGITATDELYDRTMLQNYNHDTYGKQDKAA